MSYLKAKDIVPYAVSKIGLPYVYGACGQTVTDALVNQLAKEYPSRYTATYIMKAKNAIGKQAFDCVNLIKFFVWRQSMKNYRTAEDVNADGAFSKAAVKGDIKTIPNTPGICVYFKGHIGVYIGNGDVVEARGIDYGVVKTKLKDRPWTHWLQFPFLAYGNTSIPPNTTITTTKTMPVLKQGAKGEDVKTLQNTLNKQAAAALAVDGSFGPLTDKAVREFQRKKGLAVDGSVGPKTWAALGY